MSTLKVGTITATGSGTSITIDKNVLIDPEGSLTLTFGDITLEDGNMIVEGSLHIGADTGHIGTPHVTITNVLETSLSTGVGSIKLKGVTNSDNAGFLKIYLQDGTPAYIPYFTVIS
jgi:hypothetical protein